MADLIEVSNTSTVRAPALGRPNTRATIPGHTSQIGVTMPPWLIQGGWLPSTCSPAVVG